MKTKTKNTKQNGLVQQITSITELATSAVADGIDKVTLTVPDTLPVVISRRLSGFTARVSITVGGHTFWDERISDRSLEPYGGLLEAWDHMLDLSDHCKQQRRENAVNALIDAIQVD